MRKISYMQFIAILIVSRLFVTMAYSPAGDENSLVTIFGGIISSAVQAILIIAPIALVKKFPDKNVVDISYNVAVPVGVFISALYAAFLIWASVNTMCDFSSFITLAFPIFTAKRVIILFMAAAALYISILGLEPIVRSALIVLALFFIMLIAVLLGTSGEIDVHNLDISVSDPLKQCVMSAVNSTGRNTCIVVACLILPRLRSGQAGAMYSYLGIKYAVIGVIMFLYTAILGNFSYSMQLPFFHLSSYSHSSIIARFDSLFLIVWTLCAVMKLSAYTLLAGDCIRCFSPKIGRGCANIAVSIITTAIVMLQVGSIDRMKTDSYPLLASAALVLLAGVIPALMLLVPKAKKGE